MGDSNLLRNEEKGAAQHDKESVLDWYLLFVYRHKLP
jgi:hypothetical protein